MEVVIEILQITIPGLIVFFTAYYMIKTFMQNERKKQELELRSNIIKETTPIKIQAYERLVLFLERINPESLLPRTQSPSMSSGQLHADLLATVRAEFEHNLSQQIYVSSQTWGAIKQTKEHIIKIINTEASNIDPKRPASELSEAILRSIMKFEHNPIIITIEILKNEASNFI
ncbi:MAG: hypothetical protein PF481_05625 [Bacteroidales bacterium]|jgi:hypothetical protein|nr:hypothetical protein [Bacteroidales bacterium]